MPTALEDCRVVLVRPAIAGNLGATARVMRNFGLSDLRLVAPHADPLAEEARRLSTHGEAILHDARRHDDLGAAVADCALVVATSARRGGLFRQQAVVTPREIMPRLLATAARQPVALVFGPEQTGLTNVEISRCHYLITIPADETYPALNLAQAVAVCLYELFVAGLALQAQTAPPDVATFQHQERMFADLREALTDVHFLHGDKADSLFHAVRHLISRSQPSPTEVDILLGLARQLKWWANKQRQQAATAEGFKG